MLTVFFIGILLALIYLALSNIMPSCPKCQSKEWDKDLWPHRAICRNCGQDIRL